MLVLARASSGRTMGNSFVMKEVRFRFRLDIRKKFFTERLVNNLSGADCPEKL